MPLTTTVVAMAENGDKPREIGPFQRLGSTQEHRPTTAETEPVNRFKVHQGGRSSCPRRRATGPLDVAELFREPEPSEELAAPDVSESGREILAYVGGKPLSWEDIERLADQQGAPEASLDESSSEQVAESETVRPRRRRRLIVRGAIAASIVSICALTYLTYAASYLRAHSPEAAAKRDLAARSTQSLELTERSPLADRLETQQPQFIFITDQPSSESDRVIEPAIIESEIRSQLNSHAFPDIGVSADARGEVYLAGVVYSMDEVPKIKRIARQVKGVRAVHFLHPDLRAPTGPAYFGASASNDPSVFGAKVEDVIPGSPAEKAGIKRGDVIREFNNQTIPDAHTLNAQVAACAPGARVEVRVYREGMDEILGARLLDNTVLAGS
jgi:hypothetical protein